MARRDCNAWMWAEACEMLERAQRLQRQFFRLGRVLAAQPCWEPPVDIVACNRELRITVALPGVQPERVHVQIEADRLLIDATRNAALDRQTTAVYRLEIPYGSFQRHIVLPAYRWSLVDQSFKDGCLLLRLTQC